MSCPRTQRNVPGQGSNPDRSIRRRALQRLIFFLNLGGSTKPPPPSLDPPQNITIISFRVPLPVSKRVLAHNFSKGNELFLQVHCHANQILFHMKGCDRDIRQLGSDLFNCKCNRFYCRRTGRSREGEEKNQHNVFRNLNMDSDKYQTFFIKTSITLILVQKRR